MTDDRAARLRVLYAATAQISELAAEYRRLGRPVPPHVEGELRRIYDRYFREQERKQ